MSDNYPEHLNPFANDSKHKFTDSFRKLKKTFRNSFRLKTKPDEVILRNKNVVRQSTTLYIPKPRQEELALPRSRFHERVTTIQTTAESSNPFTDEEAKVTVRRKGKKRAPLPPSQNFDGTLSVSTANSEWSLASYETDISEKHDPDENETEILEQLTDFNKNMKTLTDDSNNNLINATNDDVVEEPSKIPDLVVYCLEKEVNNTDSEENNEVAIVDEPSETNCVNILYNQGTSIYITGSNDQLDNTYTDRAEMFISGSSDTINSTTPVPKQRKNKLSKDTLLGV